MHKLINILFGIVLVLYIAISIIMDFGVKDLSFIFLGLTLLFLSVVIRHNREKRKR
jgi:hypothetical protein